MARFEAVWRPFANLRAQAPNLSKPGQGKSFHKEPYKGIGELA